MGYIKTWKQPPAELRDDLSLASSCSKSWEEEEEEEEWEKTVRSTTGKGPNGGEVSMDPNLESLTMYSGGGSSPDLDIWSALFFASRSAMAVLNKAEDWEI